MSSAAGLPSALNPLGFETMEATKGLTDSKIEYIDKGCNPARKHCQHGCRYCYMGKFHQRFDGQPLEEWRGKPILVSNILALLKDELPTVSDKQWIMLATSSDPFQDGVVELSCKIVDLFVEHNVRFRLLSKNANIVQVIPHLIDYSRDRCKVGVSLTTHNDYEREKFEPFASPVWARCNALFTLHRNQIFTWVSLEPMLPYCDPLAIIALVYPFVNEWVIGKMNNDKAAPSDAWNLKQLRRIENFAKMRPLNYYVKRELQKLAEKQPKVVGGTLDAFLASSKEGV